MRFTIASESLRTVFCFRILLVRAVVIACPATPRIECVTASTIMALCRRKPQPDPFPVGPTSTMSRKSPKSSSVLSQMTSVRPAARRRVFSQCGVAHPRKGHVRGIEQPIGGLQVSPTFPSDRETRRRILSCPLSHPQQSIRLPLITKFTLPEHLVRPRFRIAERHAIHLREQLQIHRVCSPGKVMPFLMDGTAKCTPEKNYNPIN